ICRFDHSVPCPWAKILSLTPSKSSGTDRYNAYFIRLSGAGHYPTHHVISEANEGLAQKLKYQYCQKNGYG
ncbi:MAG: hypothetical protein VW665_08790, partial [Candidatus Puniceispirillum sp.]